MCKMRKDKIFNRYKNAKSIVEDVQTLQKKWSLLYKRRNSIAHETDMIRKQKGKKIHFNNTNTMINDIKFIRDFGEFLSNEL